MDGWREADTPALWIPTKAGVLLRQTHRLMDIKELGGAPQGPAAADARACAGMRRSNLRAFASGPSTGRVPPRGTPPAGPLRGVLGMRNSRGGGLDPAIQKAPCRRK